MNHSLFNENGTYTSDLRGTLRECSKGMRVRVYRNLNKPEYYSILAMEGPDKRKVVGYSKSVHLSDVIFLVSAKSRERLLRERSKNVHAFCEGILNDIFTSPVDISNCKEVITYNPYLRDTFFNTKTLESKVTPAKSVILQGSCGYI